jgi:hypothetical protein
LSGADPPMKAGPRPIAYPTHESVLGRVVVDAVKMAFEICLVPDCMLPKPPLPDSAAPFGPARRVAWLLRPAQAETAPIPKSGTPCLTRATSQILTVRQGNA